MAREERSDTPADFGGRLAVAISKAGKTQTRTERECGLGQGRIHRLLGRGKNPILSPGPEIIRLLADYLGVSYEWLAIGRGPMHAKDWAPTPLEEAMNFARRHGAREDAIAAAAEEYRDAETMTAYDWVVAFDEAARKLDRLGIVRPEVVRKKQAGVRRAANKKRRARDEQQHEPAAVPARRGGVA